LKQEAQEMAEKGMTDFANRNWAPWAPSEGSRGGATGYEWASLKSRLEKKEAEQKEDELQDQADVGETKQQISELALEEQSQDDKDTATSESEENLAAAGPEDIDGDECLWVDFRVPLMV
jgi:hypothetical protein